MAVTLPLYLLGFFTKDVIEQWHLTNSGGFDGPLAHYASYAFRLNDVALSLLLSIILLFDFSLKLPSWGKLVLRFIGIAILILSVLGLFNLIRQIYASPGLWLHVIKVLLFQITYIVISILIIGKSFDAKWHLMSYKSKTNV